MCVTIVDIKQTQPNKLGWMVAAEVQFKPVWLLVRANDYARSDAHTHAHTLVEPAAFKQNNLDWFFGCVGAL